MRSHFNGPADVLVAPNGDIWVADGHRGGNNRIVKFTSDGRFLLQMGGGVGSESKEAGRFDDPHGLAMDSQGRLFVADRGNSRIQIFDQGGNLLAIMDAVRKAERSCNRPQRRPLCGRWVVGSGTSRMAGQLRMGAGYPDRRRQDRVGDGLHS